MEIEIVRSPRRRKTVSARPVDGVLRVSIPATMSKAEEDHWVRRMSERFARQATAASIDLPARARSLAGRFGLPAPDAIRWVDNQTTRWGSCTSSTSTVRISSEVAGFPGWVLDYVIVHEMAHLVEPHHGPAFWELVGRYPLSERARGFLIAKSHDGAASLVRES